MGISKILYGSETLIDLTNDSVTPTTLAVGVTAHNAAGEVIEGEMPTTTVLYTEQTLTEEQKAQARNNIGITGTGEKGEKGEKGMNWRGEWNAGTIYVPNDVVSYNGSSYINTVYGPATTPAGISPDDSADDWGLVAKAGDKGEKGDTGAAGKTPVKGTDYFTVADKAEMVSAVIAALPVYAGEVV